MKREGHIGLSLTLVFSLLTFMSIKDINSLITAFLVVILSILPDVDLNFEIKHRKYTHNILAAIIFGIIFGLLLEFINLGFFRGFIAGFGGTILHILGDLLTIMEFEILFPISTKKFALKLFRSDNVKVNNTFFIIGIITFTIYIIFTYTNVGWEVIEVLTQLLKYKL